MAIYSGAFLAYMGLLGFWEKAMTTLALLGTAACLSILIGIPLGMFAARRPRFYSFIQPIMDFMQTMPAFVFMIPVIAFFGTGKPAAVVTTMIFGGTPVVRLTVLGPARRAGKRPGSGDQFRRKQVVPPDQGRLATRRPVHPRRHQPDHHAVARHGRRRLADRGEGAWGKTCLKRCNTRMSGRVFSPGSRSCSAP